MKIKELTNEQADDYLVSSISHSMSERLKEKRGQGRGGWHNDCDKDKLVELLLSSLSKGDMINIINLAGMVHMRNVHDE